MATTTNYSWTTPDDTALVKDGAAAIRSLGTAIDSTVFTNAGNAIAKTIVDAKGDLIVATAADTVARLASSASNGDLLTVDTSTASGLKWATPAASGGMTLISETVASGNTSISLSSIPQTYKQLCLFWSGLYTSDNSDWALRINNDSGSNYHRSLWGVSSDTYGFSRGATTSVFTIVTNQTSTTSLSSSGTGLFIIDNYASATKTKTYTGQRMFYSGSATIGGTLGVYDSTSAITSLDLIRTGGTGTFTNMTNTSIRLYGVS
jgi:hypothetical protein